LSLSLEFKSVGLLNLKKSRHSGFKTSTYTLQCEIAKKQISVLLDLRTGYRLFLSSISMEIFLILPGWLTFAIPMWFCSALRKEDTPPIVVIGLQAIFMTGDRQRYSLSRMLKDFDVWKFLNISMFKNMRLGHWYLLHRCYLGFLGLSF